MSTKSPICRLPPYTVEAQFVSLSETVDWSLHAYGVPQQWQRTRGENIRVAVLDTGIDERHTDLIDAIDDARDFTRSYFGPIDRVGHGTHVAGTIGARQNNLGVVGVAPLCRLLIAKVLGDDGSGSSQAVAAGIDWAVEAGADILSLSLGSPEPSSVIAEAVGRALRKGCFVICAAGNDGGVNTVNYPARLAETVAVGAVDRNGRVTPFSSRGEQVDLCAPGQDVLSTYLGGRYAKLSGTSMAAPFVTGVVALLISKHRRQGGVTPVTNQQELLDHLRRTAVDAGPQGKDPCYGYGIISPESVLAPVNEPTAPELRIGPLMVNGLRGTLVFLPEEETGA